MDLIAEVLQNQGKNDDKFKPITVQKQLDLEYDLGTLLCVDNNDLDLGLLK